MGQDKQISICGLDCAACPAFIAYKTDDQALREKTAAEWAEQFNVVFKPEQVNCVGCLSTEGVHIGHCAECEIRACGMKHKVENCAMCADYPCETISQFIAKVPPARANLEAIRKAQSN